MLIRDGENGGEGGMEVGEEGEKINIYIYTYLSLHCHHQNDLY